MTQKIREKQKEFCRPHNPFRQSDGRFSSRDDATSYTTGNDTCSDAIGGKGEMESGNVGKDNQKCGRSKDMRSKAGKRCKDNTSIHEPALRESNSKKQIIIDVVNEMMPEELIVRVLAEIKRRTEEAQIHA